MAQAFTGARARPAESRFKPQTTLTGGAITSDDGGRSNVLKGLEASGLLLELQVQEAFDRAGANVSNSRSYASPDSEVLRETDVVASFTSRSSKAAGYVHVVYVVECKRGEGAQWLLAVDRHQAFGREDRDLLRTFRNVGRIHADVHDVERFHRAPHLFSSNTVARRLVDLKQAQDNRNKDGDDSKPGSGRQSFAALQQVLAACDGLRTSTFGGIGPSVTIFVPVIVTGAQLWAIDLDSSGHPTAEPVEEALVTGRLRSDQAVDSVWVVRKGRIEAFARVAAQGAAQLSLRELSSDEWTMRSEASGPSVW